MQGRENKKTSFFSIPWVQTITASLICILLGLLIGFIALLIINPENAWDGIVTVLKNFWNYKQATKQVKYFGQTLVKMVPLLMCSLSVLFAYKVGLFNIGVAGQYVIGAGASLYCALGLGMPWWVCLMAAMVFGAVWGAIPGILKAYRNVNEVISGIMLNWIGLYLINTILTQVKNPTGKDTFTVASKNPSALIPSLGLGSLFNNEKTVTIAIPLAIIIAVAVWVLLSKTRLGYELKATGLNKNAAMYCGMREKFNIILTTAIAGALAALGAAMLFLTDSMQWECTQSSVPAMGFNGIAAAFLGGLNPIGTIFSAYFIQHITEGGAQLTKLGYFSQISDFISSFIIYLCAFVLFFRGIMNRKPGDRAGRSKKGGKKA